MPPAANTANPIPIAAPTLAKTDRHPPDPSSGSAPQTDKHGVENHSAKSDCVVWRAFVSDAGSSMLGSYRSAQCDVPSMTMGTWVGVEGFGVV